MAGGGGLTKPKFSPGVVKEDSPLAAEGTWVDSDKIRFYRDLPHVIGGWQKIAATQDTVRATVFDSNVFDSNVFRTTPVVTAEMYPGQVRGAHAWTDNDGKAYLAWGTTVGLFVMYDSIIYDITPTAFVPEATSTSASTYGTGLYGASEYGSRRAVVWTLDNWGENLLACPRGGTLYEWTPQTDIALPVSGAPSEIEYMFVSPERVVVLLGTIAFGSSFNPMLVRWCDQGDNTQWTPATNNIAGEFPLSRGSRLLAGLVTRSQNVLWSDTSLYTMQFTGDVNSVYVIRMAASGCGIIGPFARAGSDSGVFWVARDNFYTFNGQVAQVIPCSVRADVFENIASNSEEKVHVGWNTGFQEPWFFYSDARDATGECSRYAMMNMHGQFAVGTFDRTAWVRAGVFPFPVAFSGNHKIYYHEVPDAGDDSTPLAAFVESGFIDVGDGDTLYLIKRIVPDFHDQGPDVSITVKTRFWPNEATVTHGPFLATPTTTKLDMRLKAREMSLRFDSSGAPGSSYWGLAATGIDAQPSGEKR